MTSYSQSPSTSSKETPTEVNPPIDQAPFGRSSHVRSYVKRSKEVSGNLHIDLSDSPPFSDNFESAPVPVLVHYGARPLFRICISSQNWNIEKLTADLRLALIRGDASLSSGGIHRNDLVFGTRQGTFIHYDRGTIKIYASTPRKVMRAASRLERYAITAEKPLPSFHILSRSDEGFTTKKVEIKGFEHLDAEGLDLHYGSGFAEWSDRLTGKLKSKDSGIVILEGPPGTGKSTFFKWLISSLMKTHRFYFLQPHYISVISEPSFVNFWIEQSRLFPEKVFCIILEDSEKCLMLRADDNRSEISSLLQITDGLMGSFMNLQVLCSINCQSTQLDPALLRPGRLLARKVFGRLSREEAMKVAARLGKPMPNGESVSLAEIYNEAVEEEKVVQPGKIIGFAA